MIQAALQRVDDKADGKSCGRVRHHLTQKEVVIEDAVAQVVKSL